MKISDLKNKLDNELGNIYNVVLINGEWGIGKSFFLKNYSKEKKYIYLSMFGLENLQDLKLSFYYKISKFNTFTYKVKKILSGLGFDVFGFGITFPQLETDLNNALKKIISKKKKLTIIIDDFERHSDSLTISDILGFISFLNSYECINVIVVAAESKIISNSEDIDVAKSKTPSNSEDIDVAKSKTPPNGEDADDAESKILSNNKDVITYINFKEKIIEKEYKINDYSKDAVETICSTLLVDNDKDKKIFIEKFENLEIKNLRTLQKTIKFINSYYPSNFKYSLLSSEQRLILFYYSLIVVNEIVESIKVNYKQKDNDSKNVKKKEEDLSSTTINEDMITKIFNTLNKENKEKYLIGDLAESDKDIIRSLIGLYLYDEAKYIDELKKYVSLYSKEKEQNDKVNNEKNIINVDLKKETNDSKKLNTELKKDTIISLFYMSEDEIISYAKNFKEKFISKVDDDMDIFTFYNHMSELSYYLEKIHQTNIINSMEIANAIDSYVNKLNDCNKIYDLEDYFNNHNDRSFNESYSSLVIEKINYKYFSILIENIRKNCKKYLQVKDDLDKLSYLLYKNKKLLNNNIMNNDIINNFLKDDLSLPDFNLSITQDDWRYSYKIVEIFSSIDNTELKNKLNEMFRKKYIISNDIGKYRIETLCENYNLSYK